MLHPTVLRELLDDEVEGARARLGDRVLALTVEVPNVYCNFVVADGHGYRLRLDGHAYDAEPFRVSTVGPDGEMLLAEQWPPGLYHSIHPVLGIPFACVRGTYEYHAHSSH